MDKIFTILERLVPDILEVLRTRYQILRQVLHHQPIGRRQIAREVRCTERRIRSEIELLKGQGALSGGHAGLFITDTGKEILYDLEEYVPMIYNTQNLAQKIKHKFGLKEVLVVPGDSFRDPYAQKDLARAAARYLNKLVETGSIVAVTGGTTLAEVAEAMMPQKKIQDVIVVPARGGLGMDMEQQAGTIAAKIAKTMGAQYRLLHTPDYMEKSTAQILEQDKHIKDLVKTIRSSTILVHGIGLAAEMAQRRVLSAEEKNHLQRTGARGEALRYYFDQKGNIVYELTGIGIQMEDLDRIKHVIAVAGGSNKAQAIEAVLNYGKQHVLITDRGAAERII